MIYKQLTTYTVYTLKKGEGKMLIIKNASSSTSHKKTLSLRNYDNLRKFLIAHSYMILMNIHMNANIMKTEIF